MIIKILQFYALMGVATAIWMVFTLQNDPEIDKEDLTMARVMCIPWCICLWPVEFISTIYHMVKR